ncbi:ABC transporter permease [Tenacibaculum finnmarkense genomovar ulcerans]|uniref:ABC transporter permease n=1 Tax=Tenacibaculum finnmarkense TaxID=2781243 RepID=UPI00187B1DF2|nr:ABC transporter permease [Tenacibaculum finnmarkense]MBE7632895.1 ABC transporter permease [Tenacibaculum finnmarkense genomovar ulcerans]MCD8428764.1 ABC transporter permease [Tenacibaculum finnmarkense genomovar ulcerans]MCG8235492.1 ABC transporter permease [Tenacibaculum finnmarkense genomovar ulcerans]MCG8829623.1 ABC transporter permease [Tenacibaculum finnmarkense]
MSKLQLIIAREFKAKVKNKSFIMMTFLSPVIMIAMMALIVFLMKQNDQKIKDIVYVDNSGIFSKDNFKDTETIKYKDFTTFGIEETKKKVEAGDHFGVLIISKQDSLELLANSVEFYSKDTPGLNTIENIERNVNTHLRNLKMKELGINLEKIKAAKISSDIKMYNFSGEKSSKMINNMKIGVGTIAGYLLMMFMILYGTSVMRSVIEEKTSRIVEVIVSSVKPFQLMLGKIVGNGAAGLLQFFIWGVLLLLGAVVVSLFIGIDTSQVFSQDIDANQVAKMQALMGNKAELFLEIRKLPWFTLFFLFIFYFLGGYMLYSSLFAAVGAAVDNETDTQQFMTPIMLPLMLAVYVGAFTVVNDPHGPVSVIFSYIPLTSPIVMLMRVPFGVAWWEIALSMLLLVLSFIAIVWVAAKIYRVGILMYGKKPTYKDLWKWMRYGS